MMPLIPPVQHCEDGTIVMHFDAGRTQVVVRIDGAVIISQGPYKQHLDFYCPEVVLTKSQFDKIIEEYNNAQAHA